VYALITLDANIKDLQMVIKALSFVTLLITVILVSIIAVGIGSTYRVIVMKRITEIGIYRAIGMKSSGVKKVFLFETFFLLLAGFICGVIFALLISLGVSYLNLSVIPAFDIFLTAGRLIPKIEPVKWLLLLGVIAVTTILSVLFTIRNVVHISPVNAFATTA
ncbi:MAG: FtsX-like permease family protein, partial [Treponema sp.]|nr:FtsX-like permease family protein [Treponema sp.]